MSFLEEQRSSGRWEALKAPKPACRIRVVEELRGSLPGGVQEQAGRHVWAATARPCPMRVGQPARNMANCSDSLETNGRCLLLSVCSPVFLSFYPLALSVKTQSLSPRGSP